MVNTKSTVYYIANKKYKEIPCTRCEGTGMRENKKYPSSAALWCDYCSGTGKSLAKFEYKVKGGSL